ncbi:unnamed protein product, partial [Prorocentrum cordatum]
FGSSLKGAPLPLALLPPLPPLSARAQGPLRVAAMQSGTSKTIRSGNPTAGSSKSNRLVTGQTQNSRTVTGTKGGNSSGGGGGTTIRVECNGRDMTPKSLVPSHYQTHKADAAGAAGQPGDAPGAGGGGAPAAAAGLGAAGGEDAPPPQAPPPFERTRVPKPAPVPKEELEHNIDIVLGETETDTLLFFPSLCVALDNPHSASVSARNKAYDELCASKAESDQYKEQHAQTLNHAHKSKEVFAAPPTQESVEVNANGWDIYDTFAMDTVPKHVLIQQACDRESALTVSEAVKKPGCLFTMNEPYPSSDGGKEPPKRKDDQKSSRKRGLTGGVSDMCPIRGPPPPRPPGRWAAGPPTLARSMPATPASRGRPPLQKTRGSPPARPR